MLRKINVPTWLYIIFPWLPIITLLVIIANPKSVNALQILVVYLAVCWSASVFKMRR